MKEPKRYYCGNGEGMFEDNKNGHWVEYSEHKDIVEELTKQLRLCAVMPSLPNGKKILEALKELRDSFTDEERETMFGNEA